MLTSQCAMTVNTRVVQLFLRREDRAYVPLDNGLRLQILPDVSFLPQCQKHHFAAFIQDSAVLLVWDDQPTHILNRIKDIESQLMSLIWNNTDENDERPGPGASVESKQQVTNHIQGVKGSTIKKDCGLSEGPRRLVFIQSILTALTLILITAAIGSGVRRMMIEVKVDHNYLRLALLIVVPLQVWLALVRNPSSDSAHLPLNEEIVLHAVSRHWTCTNSGTYQPNERKHQILLWYSSSSFTRYSLATCHDPVPCLQGRPLGRHRSYCQVGQSRHIDLRDARRFCQYVRQ